jgi:hypothetical protein
MKLLLILFTFIGLNSMAFGQCDDTTKCKYKYDQLETTQYTRICPTKFSGGQIYFYSFISKKKGVSYAPIYFIFDGEKRCLTDSDTEITLFFTDGEKHYLSSLERGKQKINCDNELVIFTVNAYADHKFIKLLETKLLKGIRFSSNHVYDAMFTLEDAKRFQELAVCMHKSKEEEEAIKKKKELDDAHMIPKKKKEKKKDDDDGVHMTPKKKKTN